MCLCVSLRLVSDNDFLGNHFTVAALHHYYIHTVADARGVDKLHVGGVGCHLSVGVDQIELGYIAIDDDTCFGLDTYPRCWLPNDTSLVGSSLV